MGWRRDPGDTGAFGGPGVCRSLSDVTFPHCHPSTRPLSHASFKEGLVQRGLLCQNARAMWKVEAPWPDV